LLLHNFVTLPLLLQHLLLQGSCLLLLVLFVGLSLALFLLLGHLAGVLDRILRDVLFLFLLLIHLLLNLGHSGSESSHLILLFLLGLESRGLRVQLVLRVNVLGSRVNDVCLACLSRIHHDSHVRVCLLRMVFHSVNNLLHLRL